MSKLIPDCIPPQSSPEFSAIVREKRDGSVTYLVTYAQKLIHRCLEESLQKHGVTVAQWAVLVMLWETNKLSQKELSERVAVETPTLSRTIDRMERDGLVTRVRNKADRRHIHVCLTPYGAGLWQDLVPEAEANLDRALQGFTDQEEDALRTLLRRIISNMGTETEAIR